MRQLLTLFIITISLFLFSCNDSLSSEDKKTLKLYQQSWIDENSFQITVIGKWNRDKYFPEGEKQIQGNVLPQMSRQF